jgi:hypothetical protein
VTVPGHRDPNLANYLWDGQRIRIVDFEDAAISDPATEPAILAEHLATRPLDTRGFCARFDVDLRRLLAARRLWAMSWLRLLLLGGSPHDATHPGNGHRDFWRRFWFTVPRSRSWRTMIGDWGPSAALFGPKTQAWRPQLPISIGHDLHPGTLGSEGEWATSRLGGWLLPAPRTPAVASPANTGHTPERCSASTHHRSHPAPTPHARRSSEDTGHKCRRDELFLATCHARRHAA